jgi:pheromone shutdown protein TraB
LTNVGASDSGIAIWLLANSTIHLAGNFLLQSQTKSVLVMYTVGPIQIKGMGIRQLSMRLRFVLL